MKRSQEKELMDLGPAFYTEDEYTTCLKILFTINKLLGFFRDTVKILKQFPKNVSVVDIGCGGGLFLLHLSKRYPDMEFTGIDISEQAIKSAQNELQQWKQKHSSTHVTFQLQQKNELLFLPNSVDIVLITLVCHHIDDDELVAFLQKVNFIAHKACIINDLQRSYLSYCYYKMLAPLFRNRLITHDGLLSIQKGFTRRELHCLLEQANIKNYRIRWRFPFRWNILILKE